MANMDRKLGSMIFGGWTPFNVTYRVEGYGTRLACFHHWYTCQQTRSHQQRLPSLKVSNDKHQTVVQEWNFNAEICTTIWYVNKNIIVNAATPTSDQYVTSPYNINTLYSRQVMRLDKLISQMADNLDITILILPQILLTNVQAKKNDKRRRFGVIMTPLSRELCNRSCKLQRHVNFRAKVALNAVICMILAFIVLFCCCVIMVIIINYYMYLFNLHISLEVTTSYSATLQRTEWF